jgi:hypothetical protein
MKSTSTKISQQNKSIGASTFKPATIGITAPKLDQMGKSNVPAAKAVRKANRAGIVGRKISLH